MDERLPPALNFFCTSALIIVHNVAPLRILGKITLEHLGYGFHLYS